MPPSNHYLCQFIFVDYWLSHLFNKCLMDIKLCAKTTPKEVLTCNKTLGVVGPKGSLFALSEAILSHFSASKPFSLHHCEGGSLPSLCRSPRWPAPTLVSNSESASVAVVDITSCSEGSLQTAHLSKLINECGAQACPPSCFSKGLLHSSQGPQPTCVLQNIAQSPGSLIQHSLRAAWQVLVLRVSIVHKNQWNSCVRRRSSWPFSFFLPAHSKIFPILNILWLCAPNISFTYGGSTLLWSLLFDRWLNVQPSILAMRCLNAWRWHGRSLMKLWKLRCWINR